MTSTARAALAFLLTLCPAIGSAAEKASSIHELIESRCLDCHDSGGRKGGVDLERLLSEKDLAAPTTSALWERVGRVVRAGEMPPRKKDALSDAEKAAVAAWFESTYVLRDGKEHIGRSWLRRLTRYELINTLEDLLHIQLKPAYVYSPEVPSFLPSTIETILPADAPGESGFDNDAAQLADTKPPLLKYQRAFDYALRTFSQTTAARKAVFGFDDDAPNLATDEAKRILKRFIARAYRGYRNAENESLVLRAYERQRKDNAAIPSLIHAMKIALLSPAFTYRMEAVQERRTPYRVSAYELATRLSYFLWGTMPDAELFALAKDGTLLDERILDRQIDRMLGSPRRVALSEDFAGQWLGFRELWTRASQGGSFYRNESWNRGIYDELLFFFDELVRSDRSLLEVVDSDWIYKSHHTDVRTEGKRHSFESKHADIFAARKKRPKGISERFYTPPQLIKIDSEQRGGMITTVGILRATSAPERTNPIRRGVWLLDKILGRQLHAPENVPALSESEKKDGKKLEDLADVLKAHTSKAVCRSCHQHIDPLGLGLEGFGPFGKWRRQYKNKRPIRASGVLPDGSKFETPRQLKKALLEKYRRPIVKNVVERMFSYALGRKLRPHDRPAVKRLIEAVEKDGLRINSLIRAIVHSKQFQHRQDKA